jgi:hypothetical protein
LPLILVLSFYLFYIYKLNLIFRKILQWELIQNF